MNLHRIGMAYDKTAEDEEEVYEQGRMGNKQTLRNPRPEIDIVNCDQERAEPTPAIEDKEPVSLNANFLL